MSGLSSENCDIYILENGRTISDFIDHKIIEHDLKVSFRHFEILLHYNVVEPSLICTFLYLSRKMKSLFM